MIPQNGRTPAKKEMTQGRVGGYRLPIQTDSRHVTRRLVYSCEGRGVSSPQCGVLCGVSSPTSIGVCPARQTAEIMEELERTLATIII